MKKEDNNTRITLEAAIARFLTNASAEDEAAHQLVLDYIDYKEATSDWRFVQTETGCYWLNIETGDTIGDDAPGVTLTELPF